jgi:hypothetical protein
VTTSTPETARARPRPFALYRNLKTVQELAAEGPFTEGQWYALSSRPERDPEMAACIVRFNGRRLYVDTDRLDQVLEARRVVSQDAAR